MMSTEKMRVEFLTWWWHDDQRELRQSCAEGWAQHIWQASRAVIEVELPKGDSLARRMCGPGACGANPLISRFDAVEAIESLGLKVKP